MKKIILGAFAMITFGVSQAQDLKFGAKAGANFATLTGDAVGDDVKMKVGFHVGGLVEIKFTDKLSLQPEVLYSLQGAKTTDRDDDGAGTTFEDESKIDLSYINVPIMVKFYPVKGFFIEAGPQVGFLVGAKAKTDSTETFDDGNTITTTSSSSDTDVKDFYKGIDVDFNAGLGYDFTDNIFVNARYSLGLTNIADVPSVFGFGGFGGIEYDEKNSVISVSVGFKF